MLQNQRYESHVSIFTRENIIMFSWSGSRIHQQGPQNKLINSRKRYFDAALKLRLSRIQRTKSRNPNHRNMHVIPLFGRHPWKSWSGGPPWLKFLEQVKGTSLFFACSILLAALPRPEYAKKTKNSSCLTTAFLFYNDFFIKKGASAVTQVPYEYDIYWDVFHLVRF